VGDIGLVACQSEMSLSEDGAGPVDTHLTSWKISHPHKAAFGVIHNHDPRDFILSRLQGLTPYPRARHPSSTSASWAVHKRSKYRVSAIRPPASHAHGSPCIKYIGVMALRDIRMRAHPPFEVVLADLAKERITGIALGTPRFACELGWQRQNRHGGIKSCPQKERDR
jgi:hypothetical protein